MPRDSALLASALLLAACGSGSAATAPASASALQAQTVAAATPSGTTPLADIGMTEAMLQAQVLCTTSLTYRPCGLVPTADTVNCFLLCQGQIVAGATSLLTQAALECAAQPKLQPEAVSPACEMRVPDESPVNAAQLSAACNARCRELQSDGGAGSTP